MAQVKIILTGVARVTDFFENGMPQEVVFADDEIITEVSGNVTIYVEGWETSCTCLVEDNITGETIKKLKEYDFDDNGSAIISILNL